MKKHQKFENPSEMLQVLPSISDCPIQKMIIKNDVIIICFSDIYNDLKNKHLQLRISRWTDFVGRHFVSDSPFASPSVKNISETEIEPFELIQEIFSKDNILIIKGYSAISKTWLEYAFSSPSLEILSMADENP